MENAWLIGLILGAANFIPGVLLAVFHRPIGTWGAKLNQEQRNIPFFRIFVFGKLYEERRSRMFILILGIWQVVIGIIFLFLIPALMRYDLLHNAGNDAMPRATQNVSIRGE